MRILVADDHHLARRCINRILSSYPQLQLCGEASDGAEVIRMAIELSPDLIILDLNMPIVNGLEVSRTVRKRLPHIRSLIVTQDDPDLMLPAALAAGADGCVDKSRLAVDLVPAILRIEASLALAPKPVSSARTPRPQL